MSILIKNLDMPKDEILSIQIHPDGSVYQGLPLFLNKLQAQAVKIPTPHGDLVDRDIVRDECYKTMEELIQSTTINMSAESLSLLCGFTIINNVPTIIEAED